MTNPLERIPTEWWPFIAGAGALALLGTLMLVGWAGIRFGRRRRTDAPVTQADKVRDRKLFRAAVAAGALVWAVQVTGSYEGLTAFANTNLGWTDWREALVPISLDGSGIAFGFLAFRAVAKRRSPYACYAVVWAGAGASAWFNFLQGGEQHHATAGMYLAFLSLASMVMLHVFLEQFREGAALVERLNPKFGARWATYLPNTLCAWLAWTNHPVPAGTEPTLANALAHLAAVREAKRNARHARYAEAAEWATAWWMHAVPWLRVRHFTAALTTERAQHQAELAAARAEANAALAEQHATMTATREAETAEISARLDQVAAEYAAAVKAGEQELADRDEMAGLLREESEANLAAERARVEEIRSDAAQAVERLREDHAREVAALRAQHEAERSALTQRLNAAGAERTGAEHRAAVAAERSSAVAEHLASEQARAERAEQTAETLRSEFEQRTGALRLEAEQARARAAEQSERLRAEHAEQMLRLEAEHAEQIGALRAEQAGTAERSSRNGASPRIGAERRSSRSEPSSARAAGASLSDEEALAAMLEAHSGPDYDWKSREVRRVTGAGFGRIEKLLANLAEHHERSAAKQSEQSTAGAAEQVS